MKVKILAVMPEDAFYEDRDMLVGLEGWWEVGKSEIGTPVGGKFYLTAESAALPRVVNFANAQNDGQAIDFFYLYKVILEEI